MPLREPLYDRDQGWLFPPSLDDLVSADSEVRLVDSAMECLDWSQLESSYSNRGRPAYSPRVLAKVLVYAYSKGVRSSRKIGELVRNDVRFMWLAKMERPDFHTIARFRKDRFSELGELFGESVRCYNVQAAVDSADGKHAFALRKQTVEPVFGHFKRNLGFDRFMLRGLAGVAAEVYLVATAHNIMKWATAQLSSRKWARLLCASLLRRFVSPPAFRARLTSHAPA